MQYSQFIKNKDSEEKTIEPFLNICRNPLGNNLYLIAIILLIVFFIMLSLVMFSDMDFDGEFYILLVGLPILAVSSFMYGKKIC